MAEIFLRDKDSQSMSVSYRIVCSLKENVRKQKQMNGIQ